MAEPLINPTGASPREAGDRRGTRLGSRWPVQQPASRSHPQVTSCMSCSSSSRPSGEPWCAGRSSWGPAGRGRAPGCPRPCKVRRPFLKRRARSGQPRGRAGHPQGKAGKGWRGWPLPCPRPRSCSPWEQAWVSLLPVSPGKPLLPGRSRGRPRPLSPAPWTHRLQPPPPR